MHIFCHQVDSEVRAHPLDRPREKREEEEVYRVWSVKSLPSVMRMANGQLLAWGTTDNEKECIPGYLGVVREKAL